MPCRYSSDLQQTYAWALPVMGDSTKVKCSLDESQIRIKSGFAKLKKHENQKMLKEKVATGLSNTSIVSVMAAAMDEETIKARAKRSRQAMSRRQTVLRFGQSSSMH